MARGKKNQYDVIIIGGGIAGSTAAKMLVDAGKNVALIEGKPENHAGSMYAQTMAGALRNIAQTYSNAKTADYLGLRSSTLGYNYPSVHAAAKSIAKKASAGYSLGALEKLGVTTIRGKAQFVQANTVFVGGHEIKAKKFIIASGARPYVPPVMGLKEAGFVTDEQLLHGAKLPKSVVIIGGGEMAVELSETLSAFKVKVTLLERSPSLLPTFDRHVGKIQAAIAQRKGIDVQLNIHRMQAGKNASKKHIEFVDTKGHTANVQADEIVLASGRRANLDLELRAADVEFDDHGIVVNQQMQTSCKHIWAAGDVVDVDHCSSAAARQGQIAAHNILHRNKALFDDAHLPRVVFSSPRSAAVGLSQEQAESQKVKYKVGACPLRSNTRAQIDMQESGFVKLLAGPKGQIIGASVVAPCADEIINQISLAMRLGARAEDLADMVQSSPTYSQAIAVAASQI